jgi:hypothetical protein
MKVILDKGPKGKREFPEESKTRAWQRANSLSWLHGDCDIEIVDDQPNTIFVWAAEYYMDKRATGATK